LTDRPAARAWRLLRDGPCEPAWNMGADEALLHSSDERPVLRLYAWDPPGLSLGWFQPAEAFDRAATEAAGARLVRRPTGGGAIHHEHELTFALVAHPGADGYPAEVVPAYAWVNARLVEALAAVDASVTTRGDDAPLSTRPRDARHCFVDPTALDLVDTAGRKVVGSAQRRVGARVLHHGSVPLRVPALTPGSGSVALAAGRDVGWDELARAVVAAFERALPGALVPDALTPAERADAAARAARHIERGASPGA
jgi:lipoate-protein ligase A